MAELKFINTKEALPHPDTLKVYLCVLGYKAQMRSTDIRFRGFSLQGWNPDKLLAIKPEEIDYDTQHDIRWCDRREREVILAWAEIPQSEQVIKELGL